jgi:hypothetical protein
MTAALADVDVQHLARLALSRGEHGQLWSFWRRAATMSPQEPISGAQASSATRESSIAMMSSLPAATESSRSATICSAEATSAW